jgi:hypothetical protein
LIDALLAECFFIIKNAAPSFLPFPFLPFSWTIPLPYSSHAPEHSDHRNTRAVNISNTSSLTFDTKQICLYQKHLLLHLLANLVFFCLPSALSEGSK